MASNFYDNTIHLDDMKNWTQFELNHRTPVIIRCDDYNNGVITRCDIATPVACLPIYLLGHLRCLDNQRVLTARFKPWPPLTTCSPFATKRRRRRRKRWRKSQQPSCDRSRSSWFWIVSEIQGRNGRVLHQQRERGRGRAEWATGRNYS